MGWRHDKSNSKFGWQRRQQRNSSYDLSLDVPHGVLGKKLAEKEVLFRNIFADCSDVVFRSVHQFLFIYIDGAVDSKTLDEAILKPLLYDRSGARHEQPAQVVRHQLVAIGETKLAATIKEVVDGIVSGRIAILADNEAETLLVDLKNWATRAVSEPAVESVIRGPRDGFTENLRLNTSLVRKRIRNPRLKMESMRLGRITQTDLVIAYVAGIVNESVLKEVKQRLEKVDVDSILESGYVEEMIEDEPFSPFPQLQNTERPDVVAASVLEGRVAIFVDGTPFALIAPMTFWSALQAAEDNYERFIYTAGLRLIRLFLLFLSILFPSLYVSITTFHPQLLPTNLLLSFASAREPSPLPAVVEALLMEFMFEGLREAGVRLPRAVGSAVSIVGALVIGQAAVEAGIVSAPMVIVVATTGIASFAIPRYSFGVSFRLLRFPMLLLAGSLGLYGVALGTLAIFSHVISLRSFGVPYFSPVAPAVSGERLLTLLRVPRWAMIFRPKLISGKTSVRVEKGQKPHPPRQGSPS